MEIECMYKKLTLIVASAVLAVPVATQAGVEVYGQARVSLDFNSNNAPSPSTACSTATPPVAIACEGSALAVSSNKSRFGFRGDEDLGGGLKALWVFEQGVNFDTGVWGSVNRDAYVGLGGGFGTVLVGRINTPYKMSTQGMDIFANTRGDYNGIIGAVNAASPTFNNRFSNSIQYKTPDMSGFKGALAYSVNTTDDDLAVSKADNKKDAFSLSGSYTQGPLFLTAAYESLDAYSGTYPAADDATAFKIGGSFALGGMTTLGAIWESADLGGANADRDAL
jgi:predicted porin